MQILRAAANANPPLQGPIYQRIDTASKILDNIVQILLPVPPLPFVTEVPSVRACLRHTFEVQGSRTLEIVYDSTSAEVLSGEYDLWPIPSLSLLSALALYCCGGDVACPPLSDKFWSGSLQVCVSFIDYFQNRNFTSDT